MQLNGVSMSGVSVDTGIVTAGLILALDPANTASYPGSGSTIYNTVTNTGYSITGTQGTDWSYDTSTYPVPILQFNNNSTSQNGGINLDSFAPTMDTLLQTYNYSITVAFVPRYYGVGGNNTGDSMIWCVVGSGYNDGSRITSNLYGTPGQALPDKHIALGLSATAPYTGGGNDAYSITYDPGISATYNFAICTFSGQNVNSTQWMSSSCSNGFLYPYSVKTKAYVPPSIANSSYICNDGGGVGSVNGYFGIVLAYNRPLSSAEQLQNYYALKTRYGIPQAVLY